MESHNKNDRAIDGLERELGASSGTTSRGVELFLRVLALALTMTASILIGVDKQTKVVPVTIVDTLPPLNVTVFAKWHYLSAFVYSMVSNAIACVYAATSIILLLTTRAKRSGLRATITILDLVMASLLFSSSGASAAIGVMGYKGNSHVRWNKVCNIFGRFCGQAASAVALSSIGGFVLLLLVVLATINLHKKLSA